MKTRGRWVFRVVGVLAIVGLSLAIAGKWWRDAQLADLAERASRLKPFVEVAPAPVPKSVPLAGDEGTTAQGFPTQWVDQAGLRSLLIHRRFDLLDESLARFEDAFEKDPRYERWPADATDAFGSAEPSLRPHLEAWLAHSPDSFGPWLARGAHLSAVAQAQRGVKAARETSEVEWEEMKATLPAALADLEHALSLRPKLVAALREELWVLLLMGDPFRFEETVRRADASCPSCFLHRVTVLQARQPRWGGSYAQMRAYAKTAPVADNPQLALLPGFVELDVADVAIEDGREGDALAEIERACALGEYWAFLKGRGHVRRHRKEYEAALLDLDRALALRPGNPAVLVERAEVYLDQKAAEPAARDLLGALRVDPGHFRAEQLYGRAVNSLLHQGWQLHLAGQRTDALRLFDLASELAPLDGEVLGRRALVQTAGDAGMDELRANVEAAPDDLRVHQQLDYALAQENRYDEVVALWTRYLAHHGEEGRAYMERAGALNHLGRRAETVADLEKACELGVTEGCARLRR